MWLKINYEKDEFEYELFKPNAISVSLSDSLIAPIDKEDKSIRVSKIFPLVENSKLLIDLKKCEVYFFDYDSAFRILGLIKQKASQSVSDCVYFSYGVCSIILFSNSAEIIAEFNALGLPAPRASEKWIIKDNLIEEIEINPFKFKPVKLPQLKDYSNLPVLLLTIIDEFAVSIKILEAKVDYEDTYSISILKNLVSIVNVYIDELIFLHSLKGEIPYSLYTLDKSRLEEPLENQIQKQQIVDRLIQINSSISYVSTQTNSGSIPILERRSLIRRSSLLGIGSSIKALNRIVDYIESSFTTVNFLEIITNMMSKSSPLNGLSSLIHSRSEWYKHSIDTYKCKVDPEENIKKLAYYSSRHAYRESEYSITASLNSVSAGLSLEWTLMTITHEMLHSHVRLILTSIFYEELNSEIENYQLFYEKYANKILRKSVPHYYLIDSIREIIFTYCVKSNVYGSLTQRKEFQTKYETVGAEVYITKFEDFYNVFQSEYRNLNEIFVHVLDLHYFYGGRTSKYIPLIWCSWSAVPHVNADIRQYILRSLLAIASKIDQEPYERWELSLSEFKTIIDENTSTLGSIALITRVLEVLNDKATLMKYYFGPFKNSLIVVDLIMDIFYSKQISLKLWDDENIVLESNDETTEEEFSYNCPLDFIDIPVNCPIPFLFDRMIKVLKNEGDIKDIERHTTISTLALNSK